jgi:hypothetical protein
MFVRTLIITVLAALAAPSLAEETAAVGTPAQDAVAAEEAAETSAGKGWRNSWFREAQEWNPPPQKILMRTRTSHAKSALQIDSGGGASSEKGEENATPDIAEHQQGKRLMRKRQSRKEIIQCAPKHQHPRMARFAKAWSLPAKWDSSSVC